MQSNGGVAPIEDSRKLAVQAILSGPAATEKQVRGSIINIGSRMGDDSTQGGGVLYSASKAAVHMFSYCLAEELGQHDIAVNILSPGPCEPKAPRRFPGPSGTGTSESIQK